MNQVRNAECGMRNETPQAPPVPAGEFPLSTPRFALEALETRLNEFEGRLLRIESRLSKQSEVNVLIEQLCRTLPSPFSTTDVQAALLQSRPTLPQYCTRKRVRFTLEQLERAGKLWCVAHGKGQAPSFYEWAETASASDLAHVRHVMSRSSRILAVLRTALPEMPAKFTRRELCEWLEDRLSKRRFERIPKNSINMALRVLVRSGEMALVGRVRGGDPHRPFRGDAKINLYALGPKARTAGGLPRTEAQAKWDEFRSQIQIPEDRE